MLKATCDFQSSTLGYVSKGDVIPEGDHARDLVSVGLAERERKVVNRTPKAGPAKEENEYSTKVVPNKGRNTKSNKGSSRGRKRNSSHTAKR